MHVSVRRALPLFMRAAEAPRSGLGRNGSHVQNLSACHAWWEARREFIPLALNGSAGALSYPARNCLQGGRRVGCLKASAWSGSLSESGWSTSLLARDRSKLVEGRDDR